jgi:uncharacterized protein
MNRQTVAGFVGFFVLGFLVSGLQIPDPTVDGPASGSAKIAAVSQSGVGAIGTADVAIRDGNGRTLVDSEPFVETDTQLSARTAREVAEQLTGYSLEDKDVTYSYSISGSVIGGPSAGAAMTAATVAAIENSSVKEDVAVTGTVRPDGYIGRVGSVPEKAQAAGEAGLDTFYVPEGQETVTFREPVVEERDVAPGFTYRDVEYVTRTISLNNITERRYDMETEEVSTIEELTEEIVE